MAPVPRETRSLLPTLDLTLTSCCSPKPSPICVLASFCSGPGSGSLRPMAPHRSPALPAHDGHSAWGAQHHLPCHGFPRNAGLDLQDGPKSTPQSPHAGQPYASGVRPWASPLRGHPQVTTTDPILGHPCPGDQGQGQSCPHRPSHGVSLGPLRQRAKLLLG